MPEEITALIVDDHEVVREGLRLSLSRAPHIRVIGEASDGASAVSLAERRKPQVVIMDVRMPGMDGLEATKHLTARVPETSVLIFTAYSERSLLSRGLESGAKGYILKEAPHQTLLRAIEKVTETSARLAASVRTSMSRTISGPRVISENGFDASASTSRHPRVSR